MSMGNAKSEIGKFMLDGKSPRCCYDLVAVDTRWPDFRQCSRKAVVTRKGLRYCKTHDPIERQRKADKKEKAYNDKWAKQEAAFERDRNIRELFPKLVAALENYDLSFEHQSLYKKAKSLIQ